jgi:hypothetical protein
MGRKNKSLSLHKNRESLMREKAQSTEKWVPSTEGEI